MQIKTRKLENMEFEPNVERPDEHFDHPIQFLKKIMIFVYNLFDNKNDLLNK